MNRTLAVVAVLAVFSAVVLCSAPAAAEDSFIGSRVSRQQIVGGRLPDAGAQPLALDSSGHALTSTTFRGCDSLIVKAVSCGTTPAAVPTARTAGSKSLEVTNSAENAGSPKAKCIANPSDGGVGFGATNPGIVRAPGESTLFALDETHTVVCVCDTPATGLVTAECVVASP